MIYLLAVAARQLLFSQFVCPDLHYVPKKREQKVF